VSSKVHSPLWIPDNHRILIAKLHLDYFCGLKSDRAIKEALVKLPSGINATYDEILQQLCVKYPNSIDEIKRILQWLVGSIVLLTLRELAEAVSIRPDDVELDREGIANDLLDLAESCGSLITLRPGGLRPGSYKDPNGPADMLIPLAHSSVVEYLKVSHNIQTSLIRINAFRTSIIYLYHLRRNCSQGDLRLQLIEIEAHVKSKIALHRQVAPKNS
jgi:hypothetical protein